MTAKKPVLEGVIEQKTQVYIIVVTFASLTLMLAGMWQIEVIWVCMQNGWTYQLPFNSHNSANLWFWHDIWFGVMFISWVMLALPLVIILVKLKRRE